MLKRAWTFLTQKGLTPSSPAKLRFENKEVQKKCSSELGHFFCTSLFIRDLGGVRTPNPQSRNLIFYPVELRGQFLIMNSKLRIMIV